MVDSVGNSLTALRAFSTRMEVTANNIANMQSEGYRKKKALLQETSNGGVKAEVVRIENPASSIAQAEKGSEAQQDRSNEDLAEEISEMIVTKHGYSANLEAIKAQDDMVGEALNILG